MEDVLPWRQEKLSMSQLLVDTGSSNFINGYFLSQKIVFVIGCFGGLVAMGTELPISQLFADIDSSNFIQRLLG